MISSILPVPAIDIKSPWLRIRVICRDRQGSMVELEMVISVADRDPNHIIFEVFCEFICVRLCLDSEFEFISAMDFLFTRCPHAVVDMFKDNYK